MSTRTRKKLALRLEILRTISGVDLDGVVGGGETQACTVTIETRQCNHAELHDYGNINDTVYHPSVGTTGAQNDTVYRGGGGRIYPV